MLDNSISQTDSKYFDFKTKKKNDGLYIYHHVGWSGLTIIKFDIENYAWFTRRLKTEIRHWRVWLIKFKFYITDIVN